jgi:hypothetical protein
MNNGLKSEEVNLKRMNNGQTCKYAVFLKRTLRVGGEIKCRPVRVLGYE